MAIKYIGTVKNVGAVQAVQDVYSELKCDMGDVVEPMSLHAIVPELLEGIWDVCREVTVVAGKMSRREKEAIGAAVSESNKCTYCVDAHTVMLIGLNDAITATAIEEHNPALIKDRNLRSLVKWGLESRNFKSVIVKFPPFIDMAAPEAIGTAVLFHYLNRMVTAFLGPTVLPINIGFLKGVLKKMSAKHFKSALESKKEPKVFFYPSSRSWKIKFPWSELNPQVERVFSVYYELLNKRVEPVIPLIVRQFLMKNIACWDGNDQLLILDVELVASREGISKDCCTLTKVLYYQAFAPHRINNEHIKELKEYFGPSSEESILISFAWVSLEIAMHIGIKLGERFAPVSQ